MMGTVLRVGWWILVTGVLSVGFLAADAGSVQGQEPIQVIDDQLQIRFPYVINFMLEARSSAAEITEVRLIWQAGPDAAFNVTRMNFQPGERVMIQYPLNVQFLALPPFAQVSYRWDIRDQAGNQMVTDTRAVEYEDTRKDWQVIESDAIRLLWYDLEPDFAQELFDIVSDAYDRLAADFGVLLARRPTVIIYADQQAFAEIQGMLRNVEFVVGRYFPGHNITVNLVTGEMARDLYADTLAHELSHLYSDNFYVGYARLPLWLEEGLATFNEREDNRHELRMVQRAAARGALIPMIELPAAIRDLDIQVATLAYAEGSTIFQYIHETWGQAAVADFLGQFRRTTNPGDVTQVVFGQTLPEFELGWRAWLGYPVDRVPELVATPTLQPFIFPTPTYATSGN